MNEVFVAHLIYNDIPYDKIFYITDHVPWRSCLGIGVCLGRLSNRYIIITSCLILQLQYTFGAGVNDGSVAQSFKFLGWLTLSQLIGSSLMLGFRLLKDKANFFTSETNLETIRFVPLDKNT